MNLPVGLDRGRGRSDHARCGRAGPARDRAGVRAVAAAGLGRQVVRELIAEGQRLPRRTVGSRRVRWARASYGAVHDLLTNPVYAGAFVFGRRRREKRLDEHGRVRSHDVEVPMEQWSVCMPEHHPGYVTWERVPADPRAAACERETARRGRWRRARRRRRCCRGCCAAVTAAGGCRSPIPGTTVAFHGMRACAHITSTAPSTPASRSAVSGWRGRSPARSSTRSPQPGSAPPPRRSKRSSSSTTSDSLGSGSRSSAPSSKRAARAASSTRASRRTGSSPARWSALRGRARGARAGASQARRARTAPPRAAHPGRARRAGEDRP